MNRAGQQKTRTKAPTLRRWQLGQQLRILREAAGLSALDAAHRLRCVEGKIYHMENARSLIRPAELEVLLTLYGALDRLEVLDTIRAEANQKGWWATYKLPPWLSAYIGMEDAAIRVRRFTNGPVPGMLQTEGYARVVNNAPSRLRTEDAEQNITARLQRGARLYDGDIEFHAILDQVVLLRASRIPDGIGVEQLKKILDMMELPNVTVRMLPFSIGPYPGIEGSFTLLDFPEGTLNPLVYQGHNRIEAVADKEAAEILDECYTETLRLTLDPVATAKEIEGLIRDAEECVPSDCNQLAEI